jgi:hypothetical protein
MHIFDTQKTREWELVRGSNIHLFVKLLISYFSTSSSFAIIHTLFLFLTNFCIAAAIATCLRFLKLFHVLTVGYTQKKNSPARHSHTQEQKLCLKFPFLLALSLS